MASPLFVDELLGAYDSDWGPLTLSRAEGGTGLVGYYGRPSDPSRMGQGRLAGSVVGHRFIYVWAGDESGDQGRGYFERDEAGSGLTGRWGYGQSDADGGTWHARRL